jgi:hypothetical protein
VYRPFAHLWTIASTNSAVYGGGALVHKGLVPCLIHQSRLLHPKSTSAYIHYIHPSDYCNSSFAASILDLFSIPRYPEMSVYLHPLSIPSRNNSASSDESPLSSSAAWSATTPSRKSSTGTHFLGIPGPSTPQIKDADSVDKEANAAAAATVAAATATSCPPSQGQYAALRKYSNVATRLTFRLQEEGPDVMENLKTASPAWHMYFVVDYYITHIRGCAPVMQMYSTCPYVFSYFFGPQIMGCWLTVEVELTSAKLDEVIVVEKHPRSGV